MDIETREIRIETARSVKAGQVFRRDGELWLRSGPGAPKCLALRLSDGAAMAMIETNMNHRVELVFGAFVEDYDGA